MKKEEKERLLNDFNIEFAEETAKVSTKQIMKERDKCKMWKHISTCLCIALCVMSISIMTYGIIATNRYFTYQESLVFEEEKSEQVDLSTEGGGNAIYTDGDGNEINGGDK